MRWGGGRPAAAGAARGAGWPLAVRVVVNVGGLTAFVALAVGGWRSVNARRARILRGFRAFRGCGWRLGVVIRL